MERINLFVFLNTELANGVEAYTEIGFYTSEDARVLYGGAPLGLGTASRQGNNTQPVKIPSTNYWLNQLVRTNGNLFVDKEDDFLWIRYGRFTTPRSYESQRFTYRLVQGFRGNFGTWDWDTGILVSEGT